MKIRKLFPLLLVVVAMSVSLPEGASAQCWSCGECAFPTILPNPEMCIGRTAGSPVGYTNCHSEAACLCELKWYDFGLCFPTTGATDAETLQLEETLAAIRERRSIPANGQFAYLKQGEDFVVRRKCDGAEMGRVAIAEVRSVRIGVGG